MKWRTDFVFSAAIPLMPFWHRFAEIGGTVYLAGRRSEAKGSVERGCLFRLDHRDPIRPIGVEIARAQLSSPGGAHALFGLLDDTLYVGGTFFCGLIALYVGGRSDSSDLRPVGGGAFSPGYVRSILGIGSNLLVGGHYISYDGRVVDLGYVSPTEVVKWTPLADPLDTSNGNSANVLVPLGSNLVAVGGRFFHASSSGDLNSIGILDTASGRWGSLGPPLHTGVTSRSTGFTAPGFVNAIWKEGQTLYVGGDFDEAGGVSSRGIAAYDLTSKKWSDLDGGVTGAVNDLLVTNGKLVVGGMFSQVGSTPVKSSGVAYWDIATKQWKTMDGGVTGAGRLGTQVMSLLMLDGYTLVGGLFDAAGSAAAPIDGLALWDWS